uniref:Uncharacterized protein n=1 Tax=Rhizophora mucronata TaxID=61149 RepID=A0A2P2N292_RHIMU
MREEDMIPISLSNFCFTHKFSSLFSQKSPFPNIFSQVRYQSKFDLAELDSQSIWCKRQNLAMASNIPSHDSSTYLKFKSYTRRGNLGRLELHCSSVSQIFSIKNKTDSTQGTLLCLC